MSHGAAPLRQAKMVLTYSSGKPRGPKWAQPSFCQQDSEPQRVDLGLQHKPQHTPPAFPAKIDKLILKFIWNREGLKTAKMIVKKEQSWSILNKAAVMETVWDRCEDRHAGQWNGTETHK